MYERRIGAELGMLHNLMKRQMACMSDVSADITGMQAMIVHFLMKFEKNGNMYQKDIENFFQIRRSTATGMLKLMEQHGLLQRESVEQDARLKRLVLTDKARALDVRIQHKLDHFEGLMREDIEEEELAVWFRVCKKMRANLEKEQREASEELS